MFGSWEVAFKPEELRAIELLLLWEVECSNPTEKKTLTSLNKENPHNSILI